MKIKESYYPRKVGDLYVLFPVGQSVVDFEKLIKLNTTGYFLVTKMQEEIAYHELLTSMIEEFEANDEEIELLRNDLNVFLEQLRQRNIVEE